MATAPKTFGNGPIPLPIFEDDSGVTIVEALNRRRTTREISPAPLPEPVLGGLLWAAGGINRWSGPFGLHGRTAASASNSQEIGIYVARRQGVSRYEPEKHGLVPIMVGDIRRQALTPGQKRINPIAPVHLIFVVDIEKLVHTAGFQEPGLQDPEVQKSYYYVDTGLIAENVYLYAAGHGLAAWFHNCDRERLSKTLALRESQRVLFAQSVGYPLAPEDNVS